jgi:hypothetical protein
MMFAIDEGVVVDTITVVFCAEITFHNRRADMRYKEQNETKKARIR